jgi:hypothetical protein
MHIGENAIINDQAMNVRRNPAEIKGVRKEELAEMFLRR